MLVVVCVAVCTLGIYCCDPYPLVTEIVEPEQKATSAVIFLHGAGGSGSEIRGVIESYVSNYSQFPNTRWIFPTANPREFPAFPWNGQIVNMWFSFNSLTLDYIFNTTEMDYSASQLEMLIEQQVASGIPHRNICLVGYSSGGMMALYYGYGYGYDKNLGCIGVISAYISSNSKIPKETNVQNNSCVRLPPLYIYGGGLDVITLPTYVTATANSLALNGVPVTYDFQWTATHFINKYGVEGLFRFIKESLY